MRVTKDTIIMDVLAMDEGTAKFFFEIGDVFVKIIVQCVCTNCR